MKIDANMFLSYKEELRSIVQIDIASQRIKDVGLWPYDKTDAKRGLKLNAVTELLVFNECVKRPFFLVLQKSLQQNVRALFRSIKTNYVPATANMLTYKEAFNLFTILSRKQFRAILEEYSPQSAAFNQLLTAIENRDFLQFEAVLDKGDYTDLLSWAYSLRLFLFGVSKETRSIKLNSRTNRWLDSLDYKRYFEFYAKGDENLFVEKEIRAYAGIYRKAFPYVESVSDASFEEILRGNSSICDGRWYPVWLGQLRQKLSQGTNLLKHYSYLLNSHVVDSDCEDAVFYFLGESVRSNLDKIHSTFDIDPAIEKVSKDKADRLWNRIYFDSDIDEIANFGLYVIKHTLQMLRVFSATKEILPETDSLLLEWLLNSSAYTAILLQSSSKDTAEPKVAKLIVNQKEHKQASNMFASSCKNLFETVNETITSVQEDAMEEQVNDEGTEMENQEDTFLGGTIKQKLFRPGELTRFCELLAMSENLNDHLIGKQYVDQNDIKDLVHFFTGNSEKGVVYKSPIWWRGSTLSLIYVVKQLLSMDIGVFPGSCPNDTWPKVSKAFVFGDKKRRVKESTLKGKSENTLRELLSNSLIDENHSEFDYLNDLFSISKRSGPS